MRNKAITRKRRKKEKDTTNNNKIKRLTNLNNFEILMIETFDLVFIHVAQSVEIVEQTKHTNGASNRIDRITSTNNPLVIEELVQNHSFRNRFTIQSPPVENVFQMNVFLQFKVLSFHLSLFSHVDHFGMLNENGFEQSIAKGLLIIQISRVILLFVFEPSDFSVGDVHYQYHFCYTLSHYLFQWLFIKVYNVAVSRNVNVFQLIIHIHLVSHIHFSCGL